ncbi:MAG: Hint domain-containing protein [Pseudomonadota bacterium]
MPTNFTDQFYTFDPANPPDLGTAVSFQQFTLTDQNDDGDIDEFDDDAVAGLDITASWPGDTVTVFLQETGEVTYVGTTLYISDGSVIFTPTDGQVLADGEFVSSTFVTTQGPLLTNQLGPPCFLPGTQITTPMGYKRVEEIVVGEPVTVFDCDALPVVFVRRREISVEQLQRNPRHAPIHVPAGAISPAPNSKDLYVSPQHRMLIRSKIAGRMFGANEVLAPAAQLVGFNGIQRVKTDSPLTYFHILLSKHSIIEANGILTESLFLGRNTIRDLQRAEMRAIQKALKPSEIYAMSPARTFVGGKKLKRLLERHQRNQMQLCSKIHQRALRVA